MKVVRLSEQFKFHLIGTIIIFQNIENDRLHK